MSQAGFAGPKKVSAGALLFGGVCVSYYRAGVPAPEVTAIPA